MSDEEYVEDDWIDLRRCEEERDRLTIENEDLKREIKKVAASDKEERGESARIYLEQHERSEIAKLREAVNVEMRGSLAAQAENVRLREALEHIGYDTPDHNLHEIRAIARNALKETT